MGERTYPADCMRVFITLQTKQIPFPILSGITTYDEQLHRSIFISSDKAVLRQRACPARCCRILLPFVHGNNSSACPQRVFLDGLNSILLSI